MSEHAPTTTELDRFTTINENETSVIKQDEAAVNLESTNGLNAMEEESQLEKLWEARAVKSPRPRKIPNSKRNKIGDCDF